MKTLHGRKWYKPMEIAKLGIIKNSKGDYATVSGNYDFILGLIKTGRLRAKNYSQTDRPYYLVPEDEITRYHDAVTKVGKS